MENLICTQFFDNLKSKRGTLDYINGKEHEKSRSLGRLWDKEQKRARREERITRSNEAARENQDRIKTESRILCSDIRNRGRANLTRKKPGNLRRASARRNWLRHYCYERRDHPEERRWCREAEADISRIGRTRRRRKRRKKSDGWWMCCLSRRVSEALLPVCKRASHFFAATHARCQKSIKLSAHIQKHLAHRSSITDPPIGRLVCERFYVNYVEIFATVITVYNNVYFSPFFILPRMDLKR